MATTLADIRTAVKFRGTSVNVPDVHVDWWINDAHVELCNLYPWPFLYTSETVALPHTFVAREILSVNNSSGQSLRYLDQRELSRSGVNFSDTASAYAWYFNGEALTAYPAGSDQYTVRYIKAPVILNANNDPILIPDQWRNVLVNGTVIRMYLNADAHELANPLQAIYDRQVQNMVVANFARQSEPERIIRTQMHDTWAL